MQTEFFIPTTKEGREFEARACAQALARSERGIFALRTLRDFLAAGGISLDQSNQRALIALLAIAYAQPSATDNAIHNVIRPNDK